MAAAGRVNARSEAPGPPLKWAGGKRWLVPQLERLWRGYSDRRLVEPLCGGLAIALGLRPERALLNDINPHTINFYRWLQRGFRIPLAMRNDATYYYRARARFNRLIATGRADSDQAAALFYYLNHTGYNGLCRFNNAGRFNVPFGRYHRISYVKDFSAYRQRFRNWKFTCGDFDAIELQPGDFVYADPPYDVEFTHYAPRDFRWADQVRLADWLARHRGPVVVSNQATARIVRLYRERDFDLAFTRAPRMISCTGDRTPALEMIATRTVAT